MKLYAHPFSSYSQKALIAFYENAVPFDYLVLSPEHPDIQAQFEQLWPIKRFPLLVDGEHVVMEATCIIEYLQVNHPGPVRLIPNDPQAALDVRMLDRCFDNYIHAPMQRIVANALRHESERDPHGVDEARIMLDDAYAWLEQHMADREWAAVGAFTLADCAAAPSLFYADWAHRIDAPSFPNVTAYRQRLLARPSFARAINEARPFRGYFPLGAPDRD